MGLINGRLLCQKGECKQRKVRYARVAGTKADGAWCFVDAIMREVEIAFDDCIGSNNVDNLARVEDTCNA